MARTKLAKRPRSAKVITTSIRREIKRDTTRVLNRHVALRQEVTATWSGRNRPRFIKRLPRITDQEMVFAVEVRANNARRANISVYRMLNDGTSVRHAVMSYPYVPKTRPGFIGSGPGFGRVVFVGKDVGLKGIEARKWDDTINRLLLPELEVAIYNATVRGFKIGK